jgi:[acyl-carrier-protein] S-malonyltransferase
VAPVAFLFPGQGAQKVGMGKDVYERYSVVRDLFEMASDTAGVDVARLCFEGPLDTLTATVNLQPAITVVNLAFLAVLEEQGRRPDVTAGHSLGEYSALHAAHVIRAADAVALVCRRGRLMHREATRRPGAMHALIGLPLETVIALVAAAGPPGVVAVANHNAAEQIVITGTPEAVDRVSARAAEAGARAVPLKVSGAWHSPLMADAREAFAAALDEVAFAAPRCEILLNVTGRAAAEPADLRSIMSRQLVSPVRWYEIMQQLAARNVRTFVEIGPGKVLTGLLKKFLPEGYEATLVNVNSLRSLEAWLATDA